MKRVCVGVSARSGLAAFAADPVVSNVQTAQRAGTGLFDSTRDLADAIPEPYLSNAGRARNPTGIMEWWSDGV